MTPENIWKLLDAYSDALARAAIKTNQPYREAHPARQALIDAINAECSKLDRYEKALRAIASGEINWAFAASGEMMHLAENVLAGIEEPPK